MSPEALLRRRRTDHVYDVLLARFCLAVAARPVVAGAATVVRQEYVLRVEEVLDVRRLNAIDDPARHRGN